MFKIEESEYKNYGRCLRMSNDSIELFVTLDCGPRIIRFAKIGGENMMFEDIERQVNTDDKKELFANAFGEDLGTWKILGGHRLWTSPEAMPRSYYPDCEKVEYIVDGNAVTFIPPVQRFNQQQHEIKVVISETEAKVDIYHRITNTGAWPQHFAPWTLSVLSAGGIEVVPMPNRPTGLLHNRKLTLWDYTKMNDERVTWGDKFIYLRQDKNVNCPFKFGLDSQHGWAAYFNHGDVMLKKFDIIDGADYPDEGMNFETYTNNLFIEIESLGEYKVVNPGEDTTHHESWELIADMAFPVSQAEDDVSNLLVPYTGRL